MIDSLYESSLLSADVRCPICRDVLVARMTKTGPSFQCRCNGVSSVKTFVSSHPKKEAGECEVIEGRRARTKGFTYPQAKKQGGRHHKKRGG